MKLSKLMFAMALTASSSVFADSHDVMPARALEVSLDTIKNSDLMKVINAKAAENSQIVVDLMAFYQPSYAKLKGDQWVHKRIAEMVENANQVLANSGINATIRLVNAVPVTGIPDELPYDSQLDSQGNVITEGAGAVFSSHVLNPYEGYAENAVYTKYGADLAVYFRDYRVGEDTHLGLGSQGRELSTIFDMKAVDPQFTVGDISLAHELGHNFDAGHEVGGSDSNSASPEAHAYTCAGSNTVMWSTGSAGQHWFYSDPDHLVDGEACGDTATADNTAVIRSNIEATSMRRDAPVSLGAVSFSATAYSAAEADGEATVTLVRTGDVSQEASVEMALFDGTAKYGADFSTSFERVDFAAGESTATAHIQLVTDAIEEGDETASLVLRYPYRLSVNQGNATLTITDAGAGTPGSVEVSLPAKVVEGDAIPVVLNRVGGSEGQLVVHVETKSGTAIAGVDFEAVSQDVMFDDGETQKTITINTTDNDVIAPAKAFSLLVQGDGVSIKGGDATVSIEDNDNPGVTSFAVSSASVQEGGNLTVKIVRKGDGLAPATVQVTSVDGTKKAGIDFVSVSQSLSFAQGESEKTIVVSTMDNSVAGDTGTFKLVLNGDQSSAMTITMTDNDQVQGGTDSGNDNSGGGGGSLGFNAMLALLGIAASRKKWTGLKRK